MSELILHVDAFWISPYAFSAFAALREKGVPFEVRTVALHEGAHRAPEYHDPSLTGRVPALLHDGFWLSESSAIIEYLEEVFLPPAHAAVLPSTVQARARARQVMAWVRSDLGALRTERPTKTLFYTEERTREPLSGAAAADAAKLLRVADVLIPPGEGPLFGAWSAADADLALMLHRLILNEDPVPARLRRYAQAQWSRPSMRAFVDRSRPAYVAY